MAGDVLPKLRVPKGMKHLTNPRDLLTPEQHAELQADLDRMAKLRRRVEAESRNVVMY